MKTIGLIGGVSWVSTHEYYKRINVLVNKMMGGVSSAKIVLSSFNFEEILPAQLSDDKNTEAQCLIDCATTLENAGADVILICSCTTSMLINSVQRYVKVPLVNIVESISNHVKDSGFTRVGILGTKRTMYHGFFSSVLAKKGVESVVPKQEDGEEINRIIYEELINNIFRNESFNKIQECIDTFKQRHVDAVILGCTELPLLVNGHVKGMTLVDSIQVHIDDAIRRVFPERELLFASSAPWQSSVCGRLDRRCAGSACSSRNCVWITVR